MAFFIYVALGLVLILPWFPKAFVRFVDREWQNLPWDTSDTLVTILVTLVAIWFWPLVFGISLLSAIIIRLVHRPLAKMFEREREARLKGKS